MTQYESLYAVNLIITKTPVMIQFFFKSKMYYKNDLWFTNILYYMNLYKKNDFKK